MQAVEPCHIILCDLQGVGHALDPQKQGAFFIDEIKRNYPEKFVVAYTGGGLNQAITRDAMQSSDVFLRKDSMIEDWRDKLDTLIVKLLDPFQVWERQRIALVHKGVDTLVILKLEDSFVRSIIAKEPVENSRFANNLKDTKINGDVRAVLQSLVASGLYSLLTGT